MKKVWLVVRKELKEIFQQRALIYSLCALPLIIVILSSLVMSRSINGGQTNQADIQQTQVAVGSLFRLYLLAEALITPAMIAAYSIVGEKNSRTLEPLLATPVETWQLLTAKSLSAMIPTTLATWISGALFIIEIAVFTSPAVFAQVITAGWLILIILTAPILTMTPVALAVMTSSRFNDPRAAAQVSSLIFAGLVLALTIFGRSLEISPTISIVLTILLAILGAVLLWVATGVFQRENILTQWK